MMRSLRLRPHLMLLILIVAVGCSPASDETAQPVEVTDTPEPEPTREPTDEPLPDDMETESVIPPPLFLIMLEGEEAGQQGSYCWTPSSGGPGMCRDNLWPSEIDPAGSFARDETLTFRFKELYAQEIYFEMYPIEQLAIGPSESGAVDAFITPLEDGEAQWPIITVPGRYLLVAQAFWENGDDATYFFAIDVFFDEEAELATEWSAFSIVAPEIVLFLNGGDTLAGQVAASCWPIYVGRGGASPPPFCYESEPGPGFDPYATLARLVVGLAEPGAPTPREITLRLTEDVGGDVIASQTLTVEETDDGDFVVEWSPDVPGGRYLLWADTVWSEFESSTTVFGVSLPDLP